MQSLTSEKCISHIFRCLFSAHLFHEDAFPTTHFMEFGQV